MTSMDTLLAFGDEIVAPSGKEYTIVSLDSSKSSETRRFYFVQRVKDLKTLDASQLHTADWKITLANPNADPNQAEVHVAEMEVDKSEPSPWSSTTVWNTFVGKKSEDGTEWSELEEVSAVLVEKTPTDSPPPTEAKKKSKVGRPKGILKSKTAYTDGDAVESTHPVTAEAKETEEKTKEAKEAKEAEEKTKESEAVEAVEADEADEPIVEADEAAVGAFVETVEAAVEAVEAVEATEAVHTEAARRQLGTTVGVGMTGGYEWSCGGMDATSAWITTPQVRAALHLRAAASGSAFGYRNSGPASITLWPTLAKRLRVLIYNGTAAAPPIARPVAPPVAPRIAPPPHPLPR